MTRRKSKFPGTTRDAGGFIALPWSVLDAPAYLALSAHARALLLEVARQLRGSNNGALLCARSVLAARGWNSNDTLTRAKRELLAGGFIFETVKGQRPNRAAWYAVTWLALDRIDGLDPGAADTFRRGAYRPLPESAKPDRQALFERWKSPEKTQSLHRQAVQETPA